MKISFYKSVTQPFDKTQIELESVFERIKNSRYKDLIEGMRKSYPSKEYDEAKVKLPVYRFSGIFESGTDKGIIEHSGIICLDFDKLENVEEYRECLISNKHTYACFLSPSGNGFKVLVKIPKSIENHKSHFRALEEEYGSDYWDASSVNVSRACFDSYDPNIYVNPNSVLFEGRTADEEPPSDTNVRIAIKSSNEIIVRIQSWFELKYDPNARNNSMFVLASCFNRFGIQQHECESYINMKYGGIGLSETEMDTVIKSAYRNKAEFGSQQFEDDKVVERTRDRLRDGSSVRAIRESLTEYNDDEKDIIVNSAKTYTEHGDFWTISNSGQITVFPDRYKSYLSSKGFYKYYPSELSYIFIRIEDNFVREVSEDLIKDYVLTEMLKLEDKSIYNFLANQTRMFKSDFLSGVIDTKEVEFIRDTIKSSYMFFENCIVEVTRDSFETKMYADFPDHVWKKQVINRTFNIDKRECDFRSFIFNISSKEDRRYDAFKSVVGYMLHTYKMPFFSPCIILNDENISDSAEGGSGKGLLLQAISKFKNVEILNGKNFDASKDFAFQRVSLDTQILVFDDVHEHFNFEALFSVITDGMAINRKNKDEFFIDKDKTPKIAIPTNYVLKGEGSSHERRKFEVELSNHYTKDFTPFHEFGKSFFNDWDDQEWSNFDNFMLGCVQYYLENGLMDYERINLNEKKMKAALGADFLTWITENFEVNHRYKHKDVWEEFSTEYPTYRKYSEKYSSSRLRIYGEFMVKKGRVDSLRQSKENGLPFTEFVFEKDMEDCPI